MGTNNGISISPARAADMSGAELIDFAQKFFNGGMPFIDIQKLSLYDSREQLMAIERMIKAFKGGNPFDLLSNPAKQWESLYDYYFGLEFGDSYNNSGFAELPFPSIPADGQLIMAGKDMHLGKAVYVCRSLFPVKTIGISIDDIVNNSRKEDRNTADNAYLVIVKKIVNAYQDKRFLTTTANKLVRSGHRGITVLERMLYELHYYSMTGGHLDTENYSSTICTGSFIKGYGFPTVRFNGEEVEISIITGEEVIEGNNDCSREVIVY